MRSSSRLQISAAMIILSAAYAVMVAQDHELASSVAIGYIALVLTFFILANVWKKP